MLRFGKIKLAKEDFYGAKNKFKYCDNNNNNNNNNKLISE